MTVLNKRVCRRASATAFERGLRRIVVTLHPPNGAQPERIGFRLERTRREYAVDLAALFKTVACMVVDGERRTLERRAKAIAKDHSVHMRTARRIAREESKP